jgi:hypothetical protein
MSVTHFDKSQSVLDESARVFNEEAFSQYLHYCSKYPLTRALLASDREKIVDGTIPDNVRMEVRIDLFKWYTCSVLRMRMRAQNTFEMYTCFDNFVLRFPSKLTYNVPASALYPECLSYLNCQIGRNDALRRIPLFAPTRSLTVDEYNRETIPIHYYGASPPTTSSVLYWRTGFAYFGIDFGRDDDDLRLAGLMFWLASEAKRVREDTDRIRVYLPYGFVLRNHTSDLLNDFGAGRPVSIDQVHAKISEILGISLYDIMNTRRTHAKGFNVIYVDRRVAILNLQYDAFGPTVVVGYITDSPDLIADAAGENGRVFLLDNDYQEGISYAIHNRFDASVGGKDRLLGILNEVLDDHNQAL